MSHNKICSVPHYPRVIEATPDAEIIKSIRTQSEWCVRDWAIHRHYLRLLHQEVRKRGLTI